MHSKTMFDFDRKSERKKIERKNRRKKSEGK